MLAATDYPDFFASGLITTRNLESIGAQVDMPSMDWAAVVALADQTGKSLEQIHIFVLSHVLRRPIVVYGVKVVKNFRGENLGFVNFEGL